MCAMNPRGEGAPICNFPQGELERVRFAMAETACMLVSFIQMSRQLGDDVFACRWRKVAPFQMFTNSLPPIVRGSRIQLVCPRRKSVPRRNGAVPRSNGIAGRTIHPTTESAK